MGGGYCLNGQDQKKYLEELYRKYFRILFNKSFSQFDYRPELRQLAEDCVQETFIRAMLNVEVLSEAKEPLQWLLTTCAHITISERRKYHRRRRILNPVISNTDTDLLDPRDAIADWMAEEDLLSKKDQLMSELTEQELSVYTAVYENNLPARDAAASIGTTEGGVYAALRRIRTKIRKLFLFLTLLLSRLSRM